MEETTEFSAQVIEAIEADRKIEAIKLLRAERNIDLKTAKELVDAYLAENPPEPRPRPDRPEFRVMPLLLAAVVAAALVFAYKALA